MPAIEVTETDDAEVLRNTDKPTPCPEPGDVLIKAESPVLRQGGMDVSACTATTWTGRRNVNTQPRERKSQDNGHTHVWCGEFRYCYEGSLVGQSCRVRR